MLNTGSHRIEDIHLPALLRASWMNTLIILLIVVGQNGTNARDNGTEFRVSIFLDLGLPLCCRLQAVGVTHRFRSGAAD